VAKITILFGILLFVLGIGGYLGTGQTSLTALIPSAFGLVFLLLGLLARGENLRRHAMHAAAALALLGFLGTARAIAQVFTLLGGGTVERPQAVPLQALMAVLCAVFAALCVRSFIQARRARTLQ
jgi:hypothetical protein